MNNQNEKRQLLKDILSGKVKREEVRRQLGGPDFTLLTPLEQKLLELLSTRSENNIAALTPGASIVEKNNIMFQGFNMHNLNQFILLHEKANHEQPNRHLLDRVDITGISEEETEQAINILSLPWVRQSTVPQWLQD